MPSRQTALKQGIQTLLYLLIQGWIKCIQSLTVPHPDQPFLTYLHTHLLTSYNATRLKSRNCEWNHGKQNKKKLKNIEFLMFFVCLMK